MPFKMQVSKESLYLGHHGSHCGRHALMLPKSPQGLSIPLLAKQVSLDLGFLLEESQGDYDDDFHSFAKLEMRNFYTTLWVSLRNVPQAIV